MSARDALQSDYQRSKNNPYTVHGKTLWIILIFRKDSINPVIVRYYKFEICSQKGGSLPCMFFNLELFISYIILYNLLKGRFALT